MRSQANAFDPFEVRDRLAELTDAKLAYVVIGGLNCARHGASGKTRRQLDRVAVAVDVLLERAAPETFAHALALLAEDEEI